MEERDSSTESTPAIGDSPTILAESQYDEWLIDEALEETFPASDAAIPPRPGSTVAARNVVESRRDFDKPQNLAGPSG